MSETGERVIEDYPLCQIVETGGTVHYSDEFRVYLMRLPFEQRHRIVTEIEERARIRRFVRYKPVMSAVEVLR